MKVQLYVGADVFTPAKDLERNAAEVENKKLIRKAPKLKLLTEFEREQRLDEDPEKRLLAAAATCGWRKISWKLATPVSSWKDW